MQEQGDEEILTTLASWIMDSKWHVTLKIKVPLKELFPEPEKKYLKRFWGNNSHADIAVFRHGKLTCIIEPGGSAHFKDDKQKIRDSKKDRICRTNGVNILRISNNVISHLDKTETKRLFKKYIYGKMEHGLVRRG